jgi:hypothetical protein
MMAMGQPERPLIFYDMYYRLILVNFSTDRVTMK